MQVFEYSTIEEESEALYKSKGSKFLAYAYPFCDEEELKPILEAQRKQHFKAVHFCYAYKLGADGKVFRANDDGEPSGSAGLPILSQIDSNSLTNILVLVVRYFGGTLLGVPGLIKAYKSASKMVIENARIINREIKVSILVEAEYSDLNQLLYIAEKMQIQITKRDLQVSCKLEFSVPLRQKADFLQYLHDKNLKHNIF